MCSREKIINALTKYNWKFQLYSYTESFYNIQTNKIFLNIFYNNNIFKIFIWINKHPCCIGYQLNKNFSYNYNGDYYF